MSSPRITSFNEPSNASETRIATNGASKNFNGRQIKELQSDFKIGQKTEESNINSGDIVKDLYSNSEFFPDNLVIDTKETKVSYISPDDLQEVDITTDEKITPKSGAEEELTDDVDPFGEALDIEEDHNKVDSKEEIKSNEEIQLQLKKTAKKLNTSTEIVKVVQNIVETSNVIVQNKKTIKITSEQIAAKIAEPLIENLEKNKVIISDHSYLKTKVKDEIDNFGNNKISKEKYREIGWQALQSTAEAGLVSKNGKVLDIEDCEKEFEKIKDALNESYYNDFLPMYKTYREQNKPVENDATPVNNQNTLSKDGVTLTRIPEELLRYLRHFDKNLSENAGEQLNDFKVPNQLIEKASQEKDAEIRYSIKRKDIERQEDLKDVLKAEQRKEDTLKGSVNLEIVVIHTKASCTILSELRTEKSKQLKEKVKVSNDPDELPVEVINNSQSNAPVA